MKIFDRIGLARYLAVLSLGLGAALCSLAFSQECEPVRDCLLCHDRVYENGVSNSYLHPPFERKQCGKCHLKQELVTKRSDSFRREIAEPVVLRYPECLAEHTIVIKGLVPLATYDMSVVFKDLSGNRVRKEFTGLVPAGVRNVKLDDRRQPNISEVKAGPIVKGIFLETSITWETDEPTTSCVEYGASDRYGLQTPEDHCLVRHHHINIYDLEKGKDYHFRVRSQDIFGNEAVSEDLVFDTGRISPAPDIEDKGAGQGDNRGLQVKKAQTFVLNSDLGLYLETTKPASVTVEYLKVEEPAEAKEPQIQGARAVNDSREGLRSGKELTIDVCCACHPPEVLGISHPVGVKPRRRTKIPDDLPTLEGGVVTCITCHDAHGSSLRYFGRKDLSKDTCTCCHEGY